MPTLECVVVLTQFATRLGTITLAPFIALLSDGSRVASTALKGVESVKREMTDEVIENEDGTFGIATKVTVTFRQWRGKDQPALVPCELAEGRTDADLQRSIITAATRHLVGNEKASWGNLDTVEVKMQ